LAWLKAKPFAFTDWKLVSNLPYSVASPLLVELALAEAPPERIVATVQWEVAQRLAARAGHSDYGVLTLLVQLRYEPGESFKIPPGCFFPAPAVDSACVTLQRRERELLPPERRGEFVRLVKLAFSQRRKMMLKLLKQQWPGERLEAAFAEVALSRETRAEAVSLEQFVRLTQALAARLPR
jgi:16S rRNA (adenine1518-N6/adenine1519-N6)-dimethyltransferase